jgi:hypothetical protein
LDIGLDSVYVRVDSLSDSTAANVFMNITVRKFCTRPESCKPVDAPIDCGSSSVTKKLMLGATSNVGQFPFTVTAIIERDLAKRALAKATATAALKHQVQLTFLRNDCSPIVSKTITEGKSDTMTIGIQPIIVKPDSIVEIHLQSTMDSSYVILTVKSGCMQ